MSTPGQHASSHAPYTPDSLSPAALSSTPPDFAFSPPPVTHHRNASLHPRLTAWRDPPHARHISSEPTSPSHLSPSSHESSPSQSKPHLQLETQLESQLETQPKPQPYHHSFASHPFPESLQSSRDGLSGVDLGLSSLLKDDSLGIRVQTEVPRRLSSSSSVRGHARSMSDTSPHASRAQINQQDLQNVFSKYERNQPTQTTFLTNSSSTNHLQNAIRPNLSDTRLSIQPRPEGPSFETRSQPPTTSRHNDHTLSSSKKPLFIRTAPADEDPISRSNSMTSITSSVSSSHSATIDPHQMLDLLPEHNKSHLHIQSLPASPAHFVPDASKTYLKRSSTFARFSSSPNSPVTDTQSTSRVLTMPHSISSNSLSAQIPMSKSIGSFLSRKTHEPGPIRDPIAVWEGLKHQLSSISGDHIEETNISLAFLEDAERLPRHCPLTSINPPYLRDLSVRNQNLSHQAYALDRSSNEEFIAMSVNALPNRPDLFTTSRIPFGVLVTPFGSFTKQQELPLAAHPPSGIIRCKECRSYLNPFCSFSDQGQKWTCNICYLVNDVPSDYYASLDSLGRRIDADQRVELKYGSFEYVATSDYYTRDPEPSTFLFLIDTSHKSNSRDSLVFVTDAIKKSIFKISKDSTTKHRVGILTFDEYLRFYYISSKSGLIREYVVTDLSNITIPFPTGFFVDLKENLVSITKILDQIPNMSIKNAREKCHLAPAVYASLKIMGSSGGKVLLFQTSPMSKYDVGVSASGQPPTSQAENPYDIPRLAPLFASAFVSIDYYVLSDHIDIEMMSHIIFKTGGIVRKFQDYQTPQELVRIENAIENTFSTYVCRECVMRIRCCPEFRLSGFNGSHFMKTPDLSLLGHSQPDRTYSAMIEPNAKTIQSHMFSLQVAMLYVTSDGVRKVRIHNLAIPIVKTLSEIYPAINGQALATLMIKNAAASLNKEDPSKVSEMLTRQVVDMLACYCCVTNKKSTSSLLIPKSLEFVPLHILSFLKAPLVRSVAIQKSSLLQFSYEITTRSPEHVLGYLYPTLVPFSCFLGKGFQLQPLDLKLSNIASSEVSVC
eukprot:TRINITY_DN10952_c0_g1_i3.p1 TRINITY_DN10952_c0_g1~~TRINITY_DN10952_c0_g1_i3.p1  ORF type:complete len:1060 (+),score=145.96 TRINITY_DN10952_c0_g1_i3:58-3237(+)